MKLKFITIIENRGCFAFYFFSMTLFSVCMEIIDCSLFKVENCCFKEGWLYYMLHRDVDVSDNVIYLRSHVLCGIITELPCSSYSL